MSADPLPPRTLSISVSNRQKDLKIGSTSVKNTLKALLSFLSVKTNEVSIQFVGVKEICQLHQEFFNDPSQTDCITFPVDGVREEDYHMLGEVFICPKTAIDYSVKHGLDPYEELTLYLVHGVLHLIGFDDLTAKDKSLMRLQEKKCLCFLKEHKNILKG